MHDIVQLQYEKGAEFPGEYVVMIGLEVYHHGSERKAAFSAYDSAVSEMHESSIVHPVVIAPGKRPTEDIMRGRGLLEN